MTAVKRLKRTLMEEAKKRKINLDWARDKRQESGLVNSTYW